MVAVTQDFPSFEPHMKGPVVFSALFHVVFVIVAIVGLPYMKPDLPEIDTSITVELVDPSELSRDAKPVEKPREIVKPQPKHQDKEEPPKPVMPTVTATKPPKPTPPAPPQKSEEKPPEKTEVKPEVSELAPPVEKPRETAKTVPPKPVQRPVLTKEKPPEEEQEQFQSLLRNLMPDQQEAVKTEAPQKPEQSALSQMAAQMSMSEMDSLRAQLSQCWSLMAGARYAEDLVVDVHIFVNSDRTVRDAKIDDMLRYNADGYFRAAAESALRAVYKCSPLDLPPEKYDQWKEIIVTFDPRTML